ncbi:MAG: hypothetical protein A2W38_05940 [Deltaproteobacteria bacterium RBG_19FT_COMBO_58_16]|nr:MAG: hypothetical protein A2W38_05940 [Deltaproteobacteria bacterium RBG_19FT_COMBO_58_16]
MVINVKDGTGATVRRSIVPCPASGNTLPLGVSGLTDKQTDALIAALAAAGTDDPILAVFGFTIVRSEGITASELSYMATFSNQGINGTGGFIEHLTNNSVTAAQLAAYRSAIVAALANPTTGYTRLYKDSVDTASATTELEKRGEAAALLLNVLVSSATTAGFPQDRVLEAFNAMGSVVVPLMNQAITDGNISQATGQMINSTVGGGIQKLKAEKLIDKYTEALTTLGASGADVTQYQSAATTLAGAMVAAFQTFEQVFTGTESDTEISAADAILNTAMNTAFNAFMTATASSDARLTTMIANIDGALGVSTGLQISNFQFYKSGGSASNWSITMVIPTDWVSSLVSAGGSLAYTRDTSALPSSMTWVGTCSDNAYGDKGSCESNGGTWTAARTDFVGDGTPASYAALLGLQEDVMIREFTRWADQSSAGSDMGQHVTLEKNFATVMEALAGNLGGTGDGATAITAAQKSALVTLLQSPQF